MAINNLDIKNSDILEPSSVLFMKPIEINKNQLIMYDNWDGNASFQYKISQKDTINQINKRITVILTEYLLTHIKEYISYIF